MGGDQQIIEEQKRQEAIRIAVEAKVMKVCEAHDTPMCPIGADPTPAYMLGNALISRGDPRVAMFRGDRRELSDHIKAAIDEHGDTCYACDTD
jgi:hypothetical protein